MDKDCCIKLNEEDINNLKVFLSRVDLKGSEVSAFASIIQAVNMANKYNDEVGDIDG